MSLRRVPLWLVAITCVGLLVYEDADRHLRAAALLMRWTSAPGPAWLSAHGEHEVITRDLALRGDGHDVDAIEYRPVGLPHPPPVLLLHGAHHRGMHESRLRQFAEALASAGLLVITPRSTN